MGWWDWLVIGIYIGVYATIIYLIYQISKFK